MYALSGAADVILRKARESRETQDRFFRENAARIAECARAMASAFGKGARLFTLGNGGSSCDAQHATVEFMHPIVEKRPPLPSITLAVEPALLTAVANDSDFALAFSQSLRRLAGPGDIALAFSTSGKSSGVNRALKTARDLGMMTVGFTGRDGGQMPALCDHVFVVPSYSTHRIQETHGALLHVLWDLVHLERGEEDVL